MRGSTRSTQRDEEDRPALFSVQRSPDPPAEPETLNKDDFLEKFKTNGRYFEAPSPVLKCYNCGEFGHMANSCSNPCTKVRCVYCGEVGHTAYSCEDVVCHSCRGVGHKISNCPYRKTRMDRCYLCERPGHKARDCMARSDPIKHVEHLRCLNCGTRSHCNCYVLQAYSKSVFCCRCGEKGHEGSECRR